MPSVAGFLNTTLADGLNTTDGPAAHAEDESRPAEAWSGLANVTGHEHENHQGQELGS